MNDNTELLKFAVENIEEWPDNIDYLSVGPDRAGLTYSVDGVDRFSYHFLGKVLLTGFKHYSSIRRAEWLEGRKENDKSKPENSNTFTKSMLEAGKHVVENEYGVKYLVLDGFIILYNNKVTSWNPLTTMKEDLTSSTVYGDTIVKVYNVCYTDEGDDAAFVYGDDKYLTLVWSREDAEKESKRKQLEEEINNIKAQLKAKEEELENANK